MNKKRGGYSLSHETRRKMSLAKKGHKHSQEAKKKMSESHKGIKNYNTRAIICMNTNERFDYMKLASEKYNIDKGNITRVCKLQRKQVNGMVFRYVLLDFK